MQILPNGIEVEGLVREFKGGVRAVDGIDLTVEPGEIYGFLGPNGAGKSTTVLMLTTLLPPTAGTARVAGHDIVREGPAVRMAIGAALQEAALDGLLTGREHMRLQTSLQGIPKAERRARGDALLERVGLMEAADRKVKGYSGGMKRRLDLALALVHHPRILFLDEPTTGLDPQSRSDMWQEVARLAHEDGVTVFLTTQYLEEADVLADRIAIIDQGKIVATGTPDALKDEIGRPTLEVEPSERDELGAVGGVLERFGTPVTARPGAVAVRLAGGVEQLAEVVRALDGENLTRGRLPAARADARRRLPGQDRAQARGRRGSRGGTRMRQQVFEMARRSVLQTLRQPALIIPPIVFPLIMMAINTGGLDQATNLPGFPADSYLDFAIAVPFMQCALFACINAGASLARDVETGFLKRLAMTPMQRAALMIGNLGGVMLVALVSALIYLVVGFAAGMDFEAGPLGVPGAAGAGAADLARLRRAGRVRRAALGLGRDGAGVLPAVLRPALPVLDEPAAAADRAGLVPLHRHLQPGLLHDRGRPVVHHRRLGRRGPRARVRHHDHRRGGRDRGRVERPADEAGADMTSASGRSRAPSPGARSTRSPPPRTLLIPSVVFPMFFFVAFAGGLSNVGNVPGFDAEFPSGYTAFQFVFVLIQASAFGGVFTGFGIASDFENGFARRLLLAAPNRYGIIAGYAHRGGRADHVRGGADLRRRAAHGDAGGRQRRRHRGARAALVPGLALGDAVRGRGGDAAAHDAGRPADADAGVPRALPRARLRAARPCSRAGCTRSRP